MHSPFHSAGAVIFILFKRQAIFLFACVDHQMLQALFLLQFNFNLLLQPFFHSFIWGFTTPAPTHGYKLFQQTELIWQSTI